MNITDLCTEINNWFETDRHIGKFAIENGELKVDFLLKGQYFRVVGSILNDGVYQYPVSDLADEVFDGAVWPMAIPAEVIDLANEITEWCGKNQAALDSPYQSESFGGYSYTKESGSNGSKSTGWQGHFSSRLNKWRKICPY